MDQSMLLFFKEKPQNHHKLNQLPVSIQEFKLTSIRITRYLYCSPNCKLNFIQIDSNLYFIIIHDYHKNIYSLPMINRTISQKSITPLCHLDVPAEEEPQIRSRRPTCMLIKAQSMLSNPSEKKIKQKSKQPPIYTKLKSSSFKSTDNFQFLELNKKLLGDASHYQKMIRNLTLSNIQLSNKYNKLSEEYKLLQSKWKVTKQTLSPVMDAFICSLFNNKNTQSKQIKQEFASPQKIKSQLSIELKTNYKDEQNMNTARTYEDEGILEKKIKQLEEERGVLIKQNEQLKHQLQQKRVQSAANNYYKKISTQVTQYQQILEQTPSAKSLRQIQLQQEIKKLQQYVKQITKKHANLNERCRNIRNMFHQNKQKSEVS